MRRIDLNKLRPKTTWCDKAEKAQKKIDNGTKKPADADVIWRELKPALNALSHGKCWYCETRETRSDDSVDHFRPKSLYPWCCCDAKNFRYACTLCNSRRKDAVTGTTGGKGDSFPLFSGEAAKNHTEQLTEAYVLIDPCVAADTILLDFVDDGRAQPRHRNKEQARRRAEESIKAYHLNHSDLVEARANLSLEIIEWLDTAELSYQQLESSNALAGRTFETLTNNIGRAIASDAPFSVFAKKVVKGYRHYEWVDDLLDCA